MTRHRNHRLQGFLFPLCLCLPFSSPTALAQGTDTLRLFPFQESHDIRYASCVALGGDTIVTFYRYYDELMYPSDSTIYSTLSTDAGGTWEAPTAVDYSTYYVRDIAAVKVSPGQILVAWIGSDGTLLRAQYDPVSHAWTNREPFPISFVRRIRLHRIRESEAWLTYSLDGGPFDPSTNWVTETSDGGSTWTQPLALPQVTGLAEISVILAGDDVLMFHASEGRIVRCVSSDGGQTWSAGDTVLPYGAACSDPWALRSDDGSLQMVFGVAEYTHTTPAWWGRPTQTDIVSAQSTDNGVTWSDTTKLTHYAGADDLCGAALSGGVPYVIFVSDRWAERRFQRRLWCGSVGISCEGRLPPAVIWFSDSKRYSTLDVKAWLNDETGIAHASLIPEVNDILLAAVQMYDDGLHNDELPGDNVFGARLESVFAYEEISFGFGISDVDGNSVELQPEGYTIYSACHDAGNVVLWIGFDGDLGDLPWCARWPKDGGENYLYSGSLWLGGIAGGTPFTLSCAYGQGKERWGFIPTKPRSLPSGKAEQEYTVSYTSPAYGTSPNVKVRQHSYQWSLPAIDDFIIFRYDIWNKEPPDGISVQDMFVGFWADADVTLETTANDDSGSVDLARHLIYMQDARQSPPGLIGIVALDQAPSGYIFYTSDPTSPVQHYELASRSGISPPVGPADYRMLLTTGPYALQPGDSCAVSFGLVMGGTLEELQTNADNMRATFATLLSLGQETAETTPQVFGVEQNFPNPFNPETRIRYRVAKTTKVRLTLHDILGREVAVLVDEKKVPGEYEVTFVGTGLATGVYFYRLTAEDFVQTRKMILLR